MRGSGPTVFSSDACLAHENLRFVMNSGREFSVKGRMKLRTGTCSLHWLDQGPGHPPSRTLPPALAPPTPSRDARNVSARARQSRVRQYRRERERERERAQEAPPMDQ